MIPNDAVTRSELPTYRNTAHWRRYQPFLPPTLRLSADNLPIEEWREWRTALIHLDRYPVASARAKVILLHGAGGYGRLLSPYALLLQRAGYEVVAPDLPGYGLSQVSEALVSHDDWVKCVAKLARTEHERTVRPVILFGMSLGGFLSYLVAAKCRVVSGVVATTLADPRLPLVQRQFARYRFLARIGIPMMPVFDRICGQLRVPVKWFSRMHAIANDPVLVRVFLSDQFGAGNSMSVHFLNTLFSPQPALEPEEFHQCPVLLVHPAADQWTTVQASRQFFDRLPVSKRLVLLDQCGHFPIEEPGLTQLKDAVLAFLQDVCNDAVDRDTAEGQKT